MSLKPMIKNYVNFSDQLPGKWAKYIKSKSIPGEGCRILEIREIDEVEYACLISRKFHKSHDESIMRGNVSLRHYTDTLIQKEPYTSDEDLKKFEMYNG